MNDYIKENAEYFDGFDFETAKPIKHPLIAKAQKQAKLAQHEQATLLEFFDSDVLQSIQSHNNAFDRQRVNTILRALFATA